jgi:ribonuclease T2
MASIVFRTVAFAVVLIATALGSTSAQEQQNQQQVQPRNQPGRFDFYVLSLSWSPSFCKESEERGRSSNEQCRGRPYSFVVHGLWPQYERGFPRDCQVPSPRLSRELMTSMLDLMPAPGLIYHEWDQHGTCSGLEAQGYFDLIRKARDTVKIPENYASPRTTLTVSPDDVEEAFVKSNPGLSRAAVSAARG